MARKQIHERPFPVVRENIAERVVAVCHRNAAAYAVLRDRLFQYAKIHAGARMRWNLHGFHAERFDRLKDRKVSRTFRGDHVTRLADRSQAQIECFHGATRDRHVLWKKAAAEAYRS